MIIDLLKFLKNAWNFFILMLSKEVYISFLKKLFKAKITMCRKASAWHKMSPSPLFLSHCTVPTSAVSLFGWTFQDR